MPAGSLVPQHSGGGVRHEFTGVEPGRPERGDRCPVVVHEVADGPPLGPSELVAEFPHVVGLDAGGHRTHHDVAQGGAEPRSLTDDGGDRVGPGRSGSVEFVPGEQVGDDPVLLPAGQQRRGFLPLHRRRVGDDLERQ